MSNKSLSETLSTIQEKLRSSGVNDALVREILSYRLLVERLGESGNNDWWESIVFSETGRNRLEEVTPKTAVKARIELGQRIGRKVERDLLPDETLSLFYLGPTTEAQVGAELNDIRDEHLEFEELEALSLAVNEPGWTDDLIDEVISVSSTEGKTIEVGKEPLTESDLQSRNARREVARRCFSAYGHSTYENLRVPYYKIDR